MGFTVQHVHIKTHDPKQTAQFYIDNFGATMKGDIPGRGFRVDLHGVQLNITGLIAVQNPRAALRHRAYGGRDRRLCRHPGTAPQERREDSGGVATE